MFSIFSFKVGFLVDESQFLKEIKVTGSTEVHMIDRKGELTFLSGMASSRETSTQSTFYSGNDSWIRTVFIQQAWVITDGTKDELTSKAESPLNPQTYRKRALCKLHSEMYLKNYGITVRIPKFSDYL